MQTETAMTPTPTSLRTGLWLGALTSLAVIGVLYAGNQLAGTPFVPFDIFDWMARVLPGGIIVSVIQVMVRLITALNLGETSSTAKFMEQSIAIVQFVGGGALLGLALAWAGRGNRNGLPIYGLMGGLILLTFTLLVEGSLGFGDANVTVASLWLTAVFLGWGWLLARFVFQAGPALAGDTNAPVSRREFLNAAGLGSAAVTLAGLGLGRWLGDKPATTTSGPEAVAAPPASDDPFGAALTSGPAASPTPEELAARLAKAPGTRDELTHNDDFYRIDINTLPARINGDTWRLSLGGLVDTPLELSLQDLMQLPAVTQLLTMQCISNPVGGDLTGTTRWTGPRLKDVLALAGLSSRVRSLRVEAADDFFEYVSLEDAMDDRTLLVYLMNGEPLPTEHGYPLRVYIPNRYGMKQPKWITNIEATDEATKNGFWVVRGWDEEANARATSVIDTVYVDSATTPPTVQVGGIAWAGERGISKVEVEADASGVWEEATLINPPLSPLTWVQWRYDGWAYQSGQHDFRVRCYEGDGTLQIEELGSARPSGATGVHHMRVNI
ncbi:MAG: molybdopterin-binding oxidoreductase [Anaerolineae bacterium]|nr:MAG: molybdopterin-binding oxidoreductase [Anaerolineae bacterium]